MGPRLPGKDIECDVSLRLAVVQPLLDSLNAPEAVRERVKVYPFQTQLIRVSQSRAQDVHAMGTFPRNWAAAQFSLNGLLQGSTQPLIPTLGYTTQGTVKSV